MSPPDNLAQRRHVLFTMLTALEWRYAPGPEPPLIPALRVWLGGWPGIGRIVAGMSRQGHDLQLARYGAEGCRQVTIFVSPLTKSAPARAPAASLRRAIW